VLAPTLPVSAEADGDSSALDGAPGLWPEHEPDGLYIGEVWLAALDSGGEAAGTAAILDTARRWIEATAANLPEEFRASFRDRNPVNRILLARAASRATGD
jgi:hypothetical protein